MPRSGQAEERDRPKLPNSSTDTRDTDVPKVRHRYGQKGLRFGLGILLGVKASKWERR